MSWGRGILSTWKPKKWEGSELFFLIMFIICILVTLKEKQVCINTSCPSCAKIKMYGYKCDKFHTENILVVCGGKLR